MTNQKYHKADVKPNKTILFHKKINSIHNPKAKMMSLSRQLQMKMGKLISFTRINFQETNQTLQNKFKD